MVPILFYLGYELLSLSFKYFIRNGNKCVWYIVYGMCWVYYVRCTVYVWVCVWRVVIWFRCHFRLSVGDTCLSRPGHSSYPDDHWHSWGGYQFTYAPYMLTHYWHYIYIYTYSSVNLEWIQILSFADDLTIELYPTRYLNFYID